MKIYHYTRKNCFYGGTKTLYQHPVHACIKCGMFPEPRSTRSEMFLVCKGCGRHVIDYDYDDALYEWNRINPIPEEK